MGLCCGIVGLPNVGKSTLFRALTSTEVAAENYPFCTIEPNKGMVPLVDPRLDKLAEIAGSAKTIHAPVEFVDIAGLIKGASQGEGLGNQFLSHIREVDSIVHVLRCFEDPGVIHVDGKIDPAADAEIVKLELALADLGSVERALSKAHKESKGSGAEGRARIAALEPLKARLESGDTARSTPEGSTEREEAERLQLLTLKPVLYVANVGDGESRLDAAKGVAAEDGAQVVQLSAQLEADLADLSEDERRELLADVGQEETGLTRLARAAFSLLNLQTYFTAGPKEARAWTIPVGCSAKDAAGVIHTDFARGFIRAEVTAWEDFIACKGEAGARTAGKLRQEGKEYVVQDGDVIHFKFNV